MDCIRTRQERACEKQHYYAFRFDQRHTVNVVVDYRITSWLGVGIRWRYGTNFPYTEPVGIKPRIATVKKNGREERVIETDINGDVIFNTDRGGEENRFSRRLPAATALIFAQQPKLITGA